MRTPAAAPLTAPTRALADLIAAEWNAVGDHLDLNLMPATRLAYTAIDRVSRAHEAVAEEVARFAGSDLLCYFAEGPASLTARQAQVWGPWLDWASDALGVALERTHGVVHRRQSPQTLDRVRRLASDLDDFALAGLASAAGLFGSAVLALALQRGALDAQTAFDAAQLDETWQAEQWGVDAEAAARTAGLHAQALALGRWFDALNGGRPVAQAHRL